MIIESLEAFEALDTQGVYDHIAEHLRAQGERAMLKDDSTTCAYRNKKGQACAFGAVIPDSHYLKEFEGLRYFDVLGTGMIPESYLEHESLLVHAQNMHDNLVDWTDSTLETELECLAAKIGLNYSGPSQ